MAEFGSTGGVTNGGFGASDIGSGIGANLGLPSIGNGLADRFGDIDDTTLSQSNYDFNYRYFPEDLMSEYNRHYIIININVPTAISGGSSARTAVRDRTTTTNEYSKVDVLRFGAGAAPGFAGGAVNAPPLSMTRATRRIKESIALYTPTPINFVHSNMYEEMSVTAMGGKLIAGALGGAAQAAIGAGGIAGKGFGGIFAGAGSITQGWSGGAQQGGAIGQAASALGYPINPRVQVLFTMTQLRQFNFDFLLAPKSEYESKTLFDIIKTLRLHSVPELDPQTAGMTFIPPAEFDITYYKNGVENTMIPRINTCVCTRVEVDYAPSGVYSTFQNGYPVTLRLNLAFQEVEVLHKLRVSQGF